MRVSAALGGQGEHWHRGFSTRQRACHRACRSRGRARRDNERGGQLGRVLSDVPVMSGYLEAQAGVFSLFGAYARLEAGARLRSNLGLFAFGEANARERMAGAAVRWTFGW